jgi:hypothetical protein
VVYRNNAGAYFLSCTQQESVMFLFNRSGLGVCLAILVAALPVFIQYFA